MRRTTVITGASSGIGEEFARRFAQQGHDVVLVARRLERLESLATELRWQYPVTVTPMALDLTEPRPGAVLRGRLAERGMVAGALVNCAGYGRTEMFAQADADDVTRQIALDVTALTDLTKAFWPDLLDAEAGGLLINVASLTGYAPMPGMAVYAAAKAFVLSFTEALWAETRDSRLRVLCLSPGATSSEFYQTSGTSTQGTRFQTPEQVVDTAFRALGTGRPTVVSGRVNALLAGLMHTLPRRIVLALTARQAPKPSAVAP
ncbi:SDR family oxidoreductase [Streptomyces sp. GD-15H]|uniref:SDR family NAD(P)-dependent oxidoreductase n=1 Tax=Streptomyces sp. GD-15H TaxID=3129112 RepID=UPI003255D23D